MAEKTEKPTDKKIKDSAKKGQSYKSKDSVAAIVLVVSAFIFDGMTSLSDLGLLTKKILLSPNNINIDTLLWEFFIVFIGILLPVLLACFLAGTLVSLLQSRFRLATEAIKLDLTKLNPIAGLKKISSLNSLKELIKAILYLLVFIVSALVFFYLWRHDIFMLYRTTIEGMIQQWADLSTTFIIVFLAVALLIIIVDMITEFFLFIKNLKMEKQEVKKEHKDNEGDPQIKSARRGLHQELLSEEVKSNVRNSTFVMANPTHIALLIYYDPDIAPLPFLFSKSRGLQAKAIIKYAEKQGVPVVRDIPLARKIWRSYKKDRFIDETGLEEIMNIVSWLIRVELIRMGVDIDNLLEGKMINK
ncbi:MULTISPECIES: EscU/YscU/HrcU family type III secretion system export apparatus switch protein [Providencia]|uniref:EscU/YscU/HrcU family type III secretion system export apparatus switch protein n=1 Tax=Providencia TaxID=586 RepID=UPI00197E1DBF|nr:MULTISPECIES: EscU/YscU/HrcU family type III secretion system export apparatus switch protein [Providencia]MBN4866012.1 EscU/YscU/HrcU family type III secretion system export apparatus switch protein [Providencia stuartii]MBN4875334.1 EscU/YscU/HrcU family type III secretion system export apparatus switch protein [Providencia stuartii]MBN4880025.1 EscU/YscU/HrcU family type III secretion system export apparatus switch protein [Providencia stuartii]MBN4884454.1 EscU/YscU/HrcU family type III 